MEITSVGQFQPVKRGEEGEMGRKEETGGRKRMEEDQDPNAMLFSSNPELTLPLGKSCSVDCPLFEETISRTILLLGSSLVVRRPQQRRGFIQFKVKLEVSLPPLQPTDGRTPVRVQRQRKRKEGGRGREG